MWEKRILTDLRYPQLNYFLAVLYFEIKNPKKFIKQKQQQNNVFLCLLCAYVVEKIMKNNLKNQWKTKK